MRSFFNLAGCFLLFSCSHFRDTTAVRFDKQEDVGSVHVAIQSVAPFEGYINSLQPQFAFNSEQAIAAAIQQTQTEDSQLFRALMASLSVGLSQNTNSKTFTTNDDGSTSATATETKGAGDLSKVTPPAAAPTNALGALALPDDRIGLDQSLKFRAAAALLQEVALLNAYVRDAAISRGARPYVVRMLVTLLPNARLEPYDAYSTISFFETPRVGSEAEYLRTAGFDTYEQDAKLRTFVQGALKRAQEARCTEPVEIIPLLVTDNLESSLHSDTVQRIRDMAAALQGFVSNVAVGANARSRAEDANKTLSRNLNSLFTLARVAPNAVEARLGAVWANGHFVMVPRTFNVTVILLVPTAAKSGIGTEVVPCPRVTFTSNTRMRDAERGTLLPSRAARILEREFKSVAANWDFQFDEQLAPTYRDLVHLAQWGDFVNFQAGLQTIPTRSGRSSRTQKSTQTMAIWNEFVALAALTGRSGGTFQVPLHDSQFFSKETRGTLIDNGKAIELSLNGGANILGDRVSGTLRVERDAGDPLFLNSTDVSVGLDGRSAVIRFPSARTLLKKDPSRIFVSVRYERGTREWQTSSYAREWYPMRAETAADVDDELTHPVGSRFLEEPIPYVFVGEEDEKNSEPDPGFTLTVPSRYIRANRDGIGQLSIEFRSKKRDHPQQVHFSVTGAFIGTTDPALQRTGADFVVPSDGAYVLTLRNLVGGNKVTIQSFRFEGEKKISVNSEVDVISE